MTLIYNKYDNIEPDKELELFSDEKEIYVNLKPTDKKCLFLLGMLFAKGKGIKLLNEKELNLESTTKSFSIMPYVWSKISDNNFPNKDFSNVITEMDKKVENIKRLGVRVNPIINKPIDNKIFLICPVRNASNETKKWIEEYVVEKQSKGIIVHAPHMHTVQTDMFGGYTICLQNENALASSSEIDLYYDQASTGSVFDLGAAYALQKPLVLLNEDEIEFDETDFMDNIIKSWPFKKEKNKVKKY